MKSYHKRHMDRNNRREQQNQKKTLVHGAKTREEDFRKMLANILADIYGQTQKAVNKHVTSALDRKALMEELDKVFGRKEEGSKIERV